MKVAFFSGLNIYILLDMAQWKTLMDSSVSSIIFVLFVHENLIESHESDSSYSKAWTHQLLNDVFLHNISNQLAPVYKFVLII